MVIKIYGCKGCSGCRKLYDVVKDLNDSENIGADIEYVTDINILASKGILQTPALEAEGVIKTQGIIPKKKYLIDLMKGNI